MLGQVKKGDKMSIEKLEKDYESYILRPSFSQHHIGMFMQHTINILYDLIQERQNIYKELAQKENIIDVNELKEVRNLNENKGL